MVVILLPRTSKSQNFVKQELWKKLENSFNKMLGKCHINTEKMKIPKMKW